MSRYDRVAGLPLHVGSVDLAVNERETAAFTRKTTTVTLRGEGHAGRGEDVTYKPAEHDALADAGPPDLVGEYTLASFSGRLDEVDLFPAGEPERDAFLHYRRWGFESAALDLALRQAGTDLGALLDETYDPVRFVVSPRLGDPPTTDRLHALRSLHGDVEFKLDAEPAWTDALVEEIAGFGGVEVVDLKGQYEGTEVDQPADPDLYRRVLEGFPDAVVEDPALTDETRPLFDGEKGRVSWDYPITGVESVEDLPFEPDWLNIKPSRFGTVESLLDTLDYCADHDISRYGGGQFELGVGRDHIQALASLFYADAPNDVAPGGYNDPELDDDLPASPLSPPADPAGIL